MEKKKKDLELLVVEDMPENLAAAKAYFQGKEGVKVDYASCFEDAKKKIEDNVYAAAIIDLNIPEKEGEVPKEMGYQLAAQAQMYAVSFLIFSAAYEDGKSFVSMQPGGPFGMTEAPSASKSESKSDPKAWKEAFDKLQAAFPGMAAVQAAKMKYKEAVGIPYIPYKMQFKPDWSR